MSQNIPNLFIVGAPRCGTTAMYTYLHYHPEICMSDVKEPMYFCSDINEGGFYIKNRKDYFSLFSTCDDIKIIGEASVFYLYSKVAAEKIYKLNPNAKIIIMLRNPYKMLPSLHNLFLYYGIENEKDINKALKIEIPRKNGKYIPKNCTRPKLLYYSDLVDFYPQVKRYYEIFGKKNIKVVIYEEMAKDTKKSYHEVLEFLGVEDNKFTTSFKRINPSLTNRSEKLRKLIFNNYTKTIAIRFVPHPFIHLVTKHLLKINTKKQNYSKLRSFDKALLKKRLEKNIINLEKLIGEDLSHWK